MTTKLIEDEINAAARIIGDISTGIYRSPANALKELVSNSFDAGATEVFINTDHPAFSNVSCFDNGPGISIEELRTIFRYIGGSDKRFDGEIGKYGRPIVGKIGIGILAMSQISKKFVIISSQEGHPFRIEAEINIEEFETPDAARKNLGTGSIGRYRIYQLPESSAAHYTIVATPAGSEVLRENLGSGRTPRSQFASRSYQADNFREFIDRVSNVKQRANLNDYEAFLWELASLCPVPYFEDGPIRGWDGWNEIKTRLETFQFRVIVDGYELRKPILLPTTSDLISIDTDYKVYPFSSTQNGPDDLSFQGYVFHQRRQISPPELQGVLVRIRNVGISGYESDMLKYPRNLGPMLGGMTGEVYVDKGLEDALNIDRNSFNETHEHFAQLREAFFRHLGTPNYSGITSDIRERSRIRQVALQRDKTYDFVDRLRRRLGRAIGKDWQLEIDTSLDSPLVVNTDQEVVTANLDHETIPSTGTARNEFFRVCFAARLAQAMGAPTNEDDAFVYWLRRL